MLPVIWPDGHMVVDVVGKMVWHKIFTRHSQIHWVPVLKLRPKFVKGGFGDGKVFVRSVLKKDIVPNFWGHLFWSEM